MTPSRKLARSNDTLTIPDLARSAIRLLQQPHGRFAVILPYPTPSLGLCNELRTLGMECVTMVKVKDNPTATKINRAVMVFAKTLDTSNDELQHGVLGLNTGSSKGVHGSEDLREISVYRDWSAPHGSSRRLHSEQYVDLLHDYMPTLP